jgi:hypothetical protein
MLSYGHGYFRYSDEVVYWLMASDDVYDAGRLDPRVSGTGDDDISACMDALHRATNQAEKKAIEEEIRRLQRLQ